MSKEVVKKTVHNTLNTKVNSLKTKIPNDTTRIHINQYNADKKKLNKTIGDVDKKYLTLVV